MSIADKLKKDGPKKLLSLDGGGIRGLITIEVLAKIEQLLRTQSGNRKLVLADYFDYIAGTSTGAVIGTLLSLGKSVEEIRKTYLTMGEMMFSKPAILQRFKKIDKTKRGTEIAANLITNFLANRVKWLKMPYSEYPDEPMIQKLCELVGGDAVSLGTDHLRTLLMVVLSNASTDSPWPISNNPYARYNDRARPDCNLDVPLWQFVRASTAAPTVFPAQEIHCGPKQFMFIDGGVTPYNNPAFQLFLQTTLEPYHLQWPVGEKEMLLISIGTGLNPEVDLGLQRKDLGFQRIVEIAMAAQFNSAIYQQDLLCRTFGRCLAGGKLDSEVKDMIGIPAPGAPKLFTYARYNVELTESGLKEIGLSDVDPKHVSKLDSVQYMDELVRVGKRVADRKVDAKHFDGFPA
jgi:uncharacterized protein